MNDNTTPNELEATKAMLEVTRMDLEEWGHTVNVLTRRLSNALDTVDKLEYRCEEYIRTIVYWRERYELLAATNLEDAQ